MKLFELLFYAMFSTVPEAIPPAVDVAPYGIESEPQEAYETLYGTDTSSWDLMLEACKSEGVCK